ncbi:MAG: hypothetical protein WBM98_06560 [Maribacter sp.]|uniref:hypothetical protein n=1 Tax=Maribacter sp. TaxID=1897614 RepID=UPI003C70800D
MGNNQINSKLLILYFLCTLSCFSQEKNVDKKIGKVSKLFSSDTVIHIKMNYVNKAVKKSTNDSTYLDLDLGYQIGNNEWKNLPVSIRSRGNNRLKTCYFVPIKLKIKKEDNKGTLFKGNKELKLVLPCLTENARNDYLLKEFLAYKLYELVSPYHFKTRLLNITLSEARGKKIKVHKIKGFFIEDIKKVANRHGGKVLKRNVHPMQQDALCSVQNAFFQFMIGNTDFSTAYQHNEKLLFVNNTTMPVPYDFDMSGLCNTSYSVVSQVGGDVLPITEVTQRMYRGFKRDNKVFIEVRDQFLENKSKMLEMIASYKDHFETPKAYIQCTSYINEFFDVIADDSKFNNEILNRARTK